MHAIFQSFLLGGQSCNGTLDTFGENISKQVRNRCSAHKRQHQEKSSYRFNHKRLAPSAAEA